MHRKKLLRADAIPLLFLRLLCQILEHLGYPAEPQHELAPSEPPPEVPSSAPQATPQPSPVIPPPSAPSPLTEPRVAIPIIEYRGLSHTYQALATSQTLEHAIPSSSEPSQVPPFVDQPMSHEEPPTGEAAEPSFPQHHPPTI
ncbi:hypothetical protein CK203_089777 [Vitis vinifera]|uniref:Uncharacterized protein n=1 Tax=Vitis vinifera TaxID=29760 RepID=A0A438BLJ1_VITVI|nr:hypothetical protein CK203_089777 [Vitis vinifera]